MATVNHPPLNPYVGPRTFQPAEAHLFFGRELEAETLTDLVASERVVLLYAQSGAGKSSLINTRLLAGLAAKGFEILPVARVGGEAPDFAVPNLYRYNLMVSLDRTDRQPQRLAGLSLADFLAKLNVTKQGHYFYDDSDLPPTANEIAAQDDWAETAWPRCLIIDQFEELFNTNMHVWPQRTAFFKDLATALAQDPYLWVLFSLREDYLAALDPFARLLPNRLQIRYYLQRMGPEAALEAIIKPAHEAGRTFAPHVAEQLVENLRRHDQFVEPVQLQIVCRDLWDKLPPTRATIAANDLQELGDVDQALMGFYESALQRVVGTVPLNSSQGKTAAPSATGGPDGVSERFLRRWFNDKLITPARTRGLVYRGEQETAGLPNEAVDSLVNSYIIRADTRGDDLWYELAHDRLVEPLIKANLTWQTSYYNPVATAYNSWQNAGRNPAKLLDGAQLKEAQQFAETHPLDVTAEENAFLTDSQHQAKQAARRRKIAIVATLMVIVVLTGLTVWALRQQNEAVNQANVAATAKVEAEVQTEIAQQNAVKAEIAQADAFQQKTAAEAAATVVTDQSILLFKQAPDPETRLNSLYRLIESDGINLAQTLLADLPPEEQLAIFDHSESEQLTKAMRIVQIEAGSFQMGSNPDIALDECRKLRSNPDECQRSWFENEAPVHTVTLDRFYIDQYEVTNAQYAACVAVGECEPPRSTTSYTRDSYYGNSEYHAYPVIYVNWQQAKTYCAWRGARLPTEAEWEKAARGTEGRLYPWGQDFEGSHVNFCDTNCTFDWANKNFDDGYADTAPVGSYPDGVSPDGVHDLAGNVWEWTSTLYQDYPYQIDDGREDQNSTDVRVLRGGSWDYYGPNVRAAYRNNDDPTLNLSDVGFRCVR